MNALETNGGNILNKDHDGPNGQSTAPTQAIEQNLQRRFIKRIFTRMSRNGTHRSHGLSDGVLQDALQVGAHVKGDDDVDDCEYGSLRFLSAVQ